ncbi:MAG TPA: hypothetical protein VE445_01365 [Nitrososphaeraceae archaeon]|nr:hypothetical protein [Nitrososphaeraceae archaeon]
MGAVFRAKDLGRDYKKIVENAVKDLSPDTKDNNRIIKLPDSWEGIRSEEKLNEIRSQDKAEDLLKNIKEAEAEAEAEAEEVNLTNDERKKLSNMFKESLTFD